jgi:hypothetical protein
MVASAAYYGDVRRSALSALAAIDQPTASLGVPFLLDAYQATQVFPRLPKHSTYDEILASGNADLLGSPSVRERISNYYWRMDGLMTLVATSGPYRDRLRSVMPYAAQAAIRARCDEIVTISDMGLATARLPESCALALDSRTTSRAVAAVVLAPHLKEDLTRAVIDLDVKLQQFERLRAGARDLRVFLDAQAP